MPASLLPTWLRLNVVVRKANYGVWLWIRPAAACFVSAVVGQAAAAAACVHCLDTLPELISLFMWLLMRSGELRLSASVHPAASNLQDEDVSSDVSVSWCLRLRPDQWRPAVTAQSSTATFP